ncbi:glycosyltransferase family 4 protein [Macrococcoides bohemicum]|uniref:glycosyltransferase family 4 protein n=1 Tax=Macrococcoides bohemicum TaxID=1903056 RepID=UPI003B004E27
MKILFISQYYEPEPFLIHDKVKELANLGHKVTVITGLPNYPKGNILDGYKPGKFVEDGVEIIRLNVRPRKNGAKNLFLNYISFVIQASSYIKKLDERFDIVYVYQLSPVLMGLPAIKYKKKYKVPMILYCLDLWPESLVSGGIRKGSLVYKFFKVISKRIYLNADSIHISSKLFSKYFKDNLGIDNALIYNPQYANEPELNKHDNTNNDLFLKDKVNITFTGNVGEMQNLSVVINALTKVDEKVHFNLVGDGSKLESLKILTKKLNVKDKVTFHGRQPAEMMKEYMEQSDALIITMKDDEVISYTLPAKVQSYLQSGKFIMGSVDGEAANVIIESQAGAVVKANDSDALAQLINDFVINIGNNKKLGLNGPVYYKEHFGKDQFIKILINDMERLI